MTPLQNPPLQAAKPQQGPKSPYFTDKKVLVTGASSGLGMSLAYYYLNNGA
jgi:NADPH:quinone reductase-like Zn-dependent oxidoreductase